MLWLWARWNMVRNKYLFFLFALFYSIWDWRVMAKRMGTSSFVRISFFQKGVSTWRQKKESLTKWYRCKSNDLDFIHSSKCNISHTHTNTHTHTIFLQSSLQIENPTKWAKKTSQKGGKEAEVGGKRDTLPFVNTHGIWNSEKLICVRLKNLKRVEAQHPPFCQQWKPVTPCRFPESWKETVDDRPNSSFRRRPHK